MYDLGYLFLGIVVGILGTLIGAGGGFLLSPIFIFLHPEMSAVQITSMSLMAIAANSLSGSVGYYFRNQVHFKSVLYFSLAALPGVYLGVKLVNSFDRNFFEMIFGLLLISLGGYLFYRSMKKKKELSAESNFWSLKKSLIGSGISFFVGILSSMLGIGGGIIHVPLLSEWMKYPLHLAAGTSHAILAITSVVAVINHYYAGDYTPLNPILPYLCVGLIIGAQGGAYLSKKVTNSLILKALSLALLAVGIRLLIA